MAVFLKWSFVVILTFQSSDQEAVKKLLSEGDQVLLEYLVKRTLCFIIRNLVRNYSYVVSNQFDIS